MTVIASNAEKKLITAKELRFGKTGILANLQGAILMQLFALHRINRLYAKTAQRTGADFAEGLLDKLNIKTVYSAERVKKIPEKGGTILIANHPTGALDGVLLIALLSHIRPDIKFMGNFLLDHIPELRDFFISVDPFDRQGGRNVSGVRTVLSHLESGGLLVIFPAGEVSTWQKGFGRLQDKPWNPAILKFIRKAHVPVVPLFLGGRNSLLFRLAGKIHPLLRTGLLPRELLNKRNRTINVEIGAALSPSKLEELCSLEQYGNYLRANVYYLPPEAKRRRFRRTQRRSNRIPTHCVINPIDPAMLRAELDQIRSEQLLFSYGTFDTYFTTPDKIPHLMSEIGRLREITFREIGEGTKSSIDTDKYDGYYRQLFIWDNALNQLVGAYRFGFGEEVVAQHGLDGFYTHSLFRMSEEMLPTMSETIELGRSFIVKAYQRKAITLMLLWKGILYILLRNKQYRYLMGPVTLSGEFQERSKAIIAHYVNSYHRDSQKSGYIHPTTGFQPQTRVDLSLIEGVDSIELINKLVQDIEQDRFTIPVLIRKYLQLHSRVLGFNTDHEFCDAVDALILLDLKQIPKEIIVMLSKELTDIDVLGRFEQLSD